MSELDGSTYDSMQVYFIRKKEKVYFAVDLHLFHFRRMLKIMLKLVMIEHRGD